MNCLESQELLQQRLDGQVFDRALLDEHLTTCAACTAQHAAAGRLQEGLRLLVPPAPPAGLRDRIVTGVLADQKARRFRVRLLAGAAMAAGLLIATLAGYYRLRPADEQAPSPRPLLPIVEGPTAEPSVPSLRESVAEAGSAVVSLTRRKADETVSQTWMFWPAVTPPPLDDPHVLSQPLEPPARSLREASQNVSAGLEPVTSSARRAVGMFLRELPPVGAEDKPGF